MKRTILTFLTLSLFIVTGSLLAQPRQAGPGPMQPPTQQMMGTRMMGMNMLNLTADQQKKIDALRLDFQKKILPLRSEVQALRTNFKLLVIDNKASEGKLKAQLQKISAKQQEMALLRAKHQRSVRALLTAEQKIKFDQHILSAKRGALNKHGKMHRKPGRPMTGRRFR